MTSFTVDHRLRPMNRLVAVSRVLLINPLLSVGLPLLILGASFVVNLAVFASVSEARDAATGGVASLYISLFIIGWVGMHQNFNFLVGLNVSRRVFWLASVLVVVLECLLYGLVLLLGVAVEQATTGWGTGMRFFDPTQQANISLSTYLFYTVPLVFITILGLFAGAVTKRFGTLGSFLLSVVAMLVVGGAVALVSYLDGWSMVGRWLASQSPFAIVTGWVLVPTVPAAIVGWLALRRAVP